MSHPNQFQGKDWQAYIKFSKQVEKKIKGSKNTYHARAVLWIKKLNSEYLGSVEVSK